MKLQRQETRLGHNIFVMGLLFSLVGAFFILEASSSLAFEVFGDRFHFFKSQLVWTVLASLLLVIVSRIKLVFWQKIAPILFYLTIVLLVMVLIPGVGTSALGASRWIDFHFFVLQPAELAKLMAVLFFAKLVAEKEKMTSFKEAADFLVLALMGWTLILLEPDLGTSLVFMAIVFFLFFVSRFPMAKMILVVLPFVALVSLAIFISPYRRERFRSYVEGVKLETASYHSKQIIYSLALGGPFGVGLGKSTQKELFLPEAPTDSVFAIVAEELGFFGSTILIGLYLFLIISLFRVAYLATDTYGRLVALGVSAWISIQSLINLASITGIIPITGVPLPFFSYGGSNLCTMMIGLGLIIRVNKETYE